jgi:AcrR family transcriptional regulator
MSFPSKTDRETILRTALEIIETHGWNALSMRALGRKLGLRASSLYHHFPDRNAIEAALASNASHSLLLALKSASAGLKGPSKIHALAAAYIDFALHNQALYNLIAVLPSSGEELWLFLLHTLKGDSAATGALWAFLHGYASLQLAQKLDPGTAAESLARGLSALLIGLSKKQNIL